MSEMNQALTAMADQLLELEGWLTAFNEPDYPAAWVFPMVRLFERLKASCEAVETLVRAADVGVSS